MEKKLLSEDLRRRLHEKYGNVASATRALGISYERTKKSLQLNKFPNDILTVLLTACDIDGDREKLEAQFTFSTTALFYAAKPKSGKETTSLSIESLMSETDRQLLIENVLVRERVAELIKRECEWARTLLTL